MKHLVLTLWFVLFLSSSALAGVEYVTESVCHAMTGCWMDTKTGECPDCVEIIPMPEVNFSTSGTLYVCEDVLKACASAGFNNCVARHNDCLLANEENENGKS